MIEKDDKQGWVTNHDADINIQISEVLILGEDMGCQERNTLAGC